MLTALLASLGSLTSAWSQEQVLIEIGDEWLYFKGTVAPPADWNTLGFDDSDPLLWLPGVSGLGYGDGDDATTLTDMQNGYMAFFARRSFTVSNLAGITRLVLNVDYDDGFVAYVNGVEVARRGLGGAPDPVAFDQAAASHEAVAGGGVPDFIDIGTLGLQAGDNVLALEIHNTTLGSTDASMIPRLVVNGGLPPTGLACTTVPGGGSVTLQWINTGVYDSIDVTRNGATLATLAGVATTYTDVSPTALDNVYQVFGVLAGIGYASVNTCTAPCTQSTLTCQLSLVAAVTQANLSWTSIPGVTSVEIVREGALQTTLTAGETSYVDLNVENQMAEDDTDFTVRQLNGAGAVCSGSCQLSLCPENLAARVENDSIRLDWTNVVKAWDHFEVSRNGVLVDPAVPGNATTWVDADVTLVIGSRYDYVLHPVPVLGGEFPAPGTQCDRTLSFGYVPELAKYNPPAGGWDYELNFAGANKRQYNPVAGETGNLDGRWIRSLDRDFWDGSDTADADVASPAGPAPGGIDIVSRPGLGACSSDTTVLRILDPGDPTADWAGTAGVVDPFDVPNNRTILLGLDLASPDENLLNTGITIATRLRTSPDAPAYMNPNPASGDGEPISAGIGQVGVYFRNPGALADLTAGAAVSLASSGSGGAVQVSTNPQTDLDGAGIRNFVSLWLTVRGTGTPDLYDVQVYLNGATTPAPGMGGLGVSLQGGVADFGPAIVNYLAIGVNSTADDAMLELDYVAYKKGIFSPTPATVTPCGGGVGPRFVRGDADSSGIINLTDGIVVLNFLFTGGVAPRCMDAADTDDSNPNRPNITDAIRIFNWLFTGGPAPLRPGPSTANYLASDCGLDPTPNDGMDCQQGAAKCQ